VLLTPNASLVMLGGSHTPDMLRAAIQVYDNQLFQGYASAVEEGVERLSTTLRKLAVTQGDWGAAAAGVVDSAVHAIESHTHHAIESMQRAHRLVESAFQTAVECETEAATEQTKHSKP